MIGHGRLSSQGKHTKRRKNDLLDLAWGLEKLERNRSGAIGGPSRIKTRRSITEINQNAFSVNVRSSCVSLKERKKNNRRREKEGNSKKGTERVKGEVLSSIGGSRREFRLCSDKILKEL